MSRKQTAILAVGCTVIGTLIGGGGLMVTHGMYLQRILSGAEYSAENRRAIHAHSDQHRADLLIVDARCDEMEQNDKVHSAQILACKEDLNNFWDQLKGNRRKVDAHEARLERHEVLLEGLIK